MPCGAIPDSGTTTIMGPADQVLKLMEGICDGWDRCRKNYTAMVDATTAAENDMKKIYGFNPFNLKSAIKKTDILQAVLADCESWMDEQVGLSELPPLHFHVQGSNGTKQTLSIPGHLYIMETPRELLQQQQVGHVQQRHQADAVDPRPLVHHGDAQGAPAAAAGGPRAAAAAAHVRAAATAPSRRC